MRKLHYAIIFSLFLFSIVVFNCLRIKLNSGAVDIISTYYSISFGFCASAVAMLFGSKLAKEMYKQNGDHAGTKTKLHVYRSYLLFFLGNFVIGILTNFIYVILVGMNRVEDKFPIFENINFGDVLVLLSGFIAFEFLCSLFIVCVLFVFSLRAMLKAARCNN